jgi:hypothetical protein
MIHGLFALTVENMAIVKEDSKESRGSQRAVQLMMMYIDISILIYYCTGNEVFYHLKMPR